MQDRADRIDLLQQAVETMSEQVLKLQTELAGLRAELEASDQRQLHLMARADQIEAMQASLSWLEHRQLAAGALRRRPLMILLRAVLLLGVLAVAFSCLTINRKAVPWAWQSASRSTAELNSILLLTIEGPTWLEVQTSDGKVLHYGMAKPGPYRFPMSQAIKLRAGRPDLVNVSFGGSTAVLGVIEDTGWRTYKPGGQPQSYHRNHARNP
jgi:hypothetical protein